MVRVRVMDVGLTKLPIMVRVRVMDVGLTKLPERSYLNEAAMTCT